MFFLLYSLMLKYPYESFYPVSLWDTLEAAKWLTRTGWMMRGIPGSDAETVSQHSWEAAVIAFLIASRTKSRGVEVNPYRAATIALFHDLLEGIIGDIPRYVGSLLGEVKNDLERKALRELQVDLEVKEMIEEWLSKRSIESRIAHVADAVATYLQALRYMRNSYPRVEEIAQSMRSKAIEEAKGSVFEDITMGLILEIEKAVP
jgi:putative hydrolase of HD superfamily